MSRKEKIIEALKRPKGWLLGVVYSLTAVFIAVTLYIVIALDYEGTFIEYVAYVLYALSAASLGYTVYTIVIYAPSLKRKITALLGKNRFTARVMSDFGYRTVVASVISFVISVVYGLFNGVIAVMGKSVWYAALAAYYIEMAFMRGGIIFYRGRNALKGDSDGFKEITGFKRTGIILVVTVFALSLAIVQMVVEDKAFKYEGLAIYSAAAFAFYKITMSVINAIRAKKENGYTVQAIRNINFADALVSVLALQTALLQTFSDAGVDCGRYNAVTGGAVCVMILALGVYMIAKANKEQNKIKEEQNGKRQ